MNGTISLNDVILAVSVFIALFGLMTAFIFRFFGSDLPDPEDNDND